MRNPEKLVEILELLEDVLRADSEHNYGDCGVYLHKLHTRYYQFADKDAQSRTPLEYFKNEADNYNL